MLRPSRRQRPLLLTSSLALAVATGLAVLPATSAQAAPSDTSVSIELRRSTTAPIDADGQLGGVYFDSIGPAIPEDTFVVSGRLTEDAAGTGLAGQEVTLVRAKKTEETGVPVATAITDAEGDYVFRQQHVVASAAYAVAFEGDGGVTYNGTDSTESADPVVVFAMRDFNASKRKVDGKLFFRGDINPGWGGRTVALQKKACSSCAWRTVSSKAAGARGAWSFRVAYPTSVGPVWRWQAVLAPAGDFEKSYSAQLTTQRVYGRESLARVGPM